MHSENTDQCVGKQMKDLVKWNDKGNIFSVPTSLSEQGTWAFFLESACHITETQLFWPKSKGKGPQVPSSRVNGVWLGGLRFGSLREERPPQLHFPRSQP